MTKVDSATASGLRDRDLTSLGQGRLAWRVLEPTFEQGQAFFATWAVHRTLTDPGHLHHVACCAVAPPWEALEPHMAACPSLNDQLGHLRAQWFGLLPGLHVMHLDGGRVHLHLWVGDWRKGLGEMSLVADRLLLQTPPPDWEVQGAKGLAKLCQRGTQIYLGPDALACKANLEQVGFRWPALNAHAQQEPTLKVAGSYEVGQFDPPWVLKNTRTPRAQPLPAGTCAVIGAGLAGASVAAALARRGWLVVVLDRADQPAQGASALPAGLLVPHVSADDSALSRLSRAGVRLMLQAARLHLKHGADWALTGAQTPLAHGAPTPLPRHWLETPGPWQDWVQWRSAAGSGAAVLTHHQAAWVKPAALVRTCLSQPGVQFQADAEVVDIQRENGAWALLDRGGHTLARAQRVVIANAMGAAPLIARVMHGLQASGQHVMRPALQAVQGQLSWGCQPTGPELATKAVRAAFTSVPLNGSGTWLPAIPVTDHNATGQAWYAGSSYELGHEPPLSVQQAHGFNRERLQQLAPAAAQALAGEFAQQRVQHWRNTRCVSADRLPLVGSLTAPDDQGLWLCAAMGSRGLSLSLLCAELLAAQWSAEPWPVEASLAKLLSLARFG